MLSCTCLLGDLITAESVIKRRSVVTMTEAQAALGRHQCAHVAQGLLFLLMAISVLCILSSLAAVRQEASAASVLMNSAGDIALRSVSWPLVNGCSGVLTSSSRAHILSKLLDCVPDCFTIDTWRLSFSALLSAPFAKSPANAFPAYWLMMARCTTSTSSSDRRSRPRASPPVASATFSIQRREY